SLLVSFLLLRFSLCVVFNDLHDDLSLIFFSSRLSSDLPPSDLYVFMPPRFGGMTPSQLYVFMPPNLGGFFMVRSYYPSECHADYFDFERIEALKPAIEACGISTLSQSPMLGFHKQMDNRIKLLRSEERRV